MRLRNAHVGGTCAERIDRVDLTSEECWWHVRSASWSCGLHSTFTKQRCNDHITRMAGSHQNRITSTSDDHSAIRHCDRSPPFMLHMRITQTARSLYGNLMSSTGESCADCSHSALTIRAQFMCAAERLLGTLNCAYRSPAS